MRELFRNPNKIFEALARLDRLEKLRIVNQTGVPIPIRFAKTDAIIDFKEPDGSPPAEVTLPLDPETIIWRDGILSDGGTFESDSIELADALIRAIKAKSWGAKVIYLLPFLGVGMQAARWPLRNSTATADRRATIHNFVDADFNQSTGLQGDGSTKWLDLIFVSNELGSNNKGVGWWERAFAVGNPWVIGSDSATQIYSIALANSVEIFYWGDAISSTSTAVGAGNNNYYGQRASDTDRKLFRNGSVVATNTTPGASITNIAAHPISLFSKDTGTNKYPGRCGVAYYTDGTLTDAEVLELHNILNDYLIVPTGR